MSNFCKQPEIWMVAIGIAVSAHGAYLMWTVGI